MARLVVRSGSAAGRSCEVVDVVVVGRDPSCDLSLEDGLVSRRHLRVRATPTGYVAEDLGSTNGTRLNGVPITMAALSPGEELVVGESTLVLEEATTAGPTTVILSNTGSHIEAAVAARKRPVAPEDLSMEDLRERVNLFIEVGEALSTVVGLNELLDNMLGELFRVFEQAQRGFVILAASPEGPIDVRAQRHRGTPDREVTLSRTIIEHVLSRGEAVLSRDAAEDDRFAGAVSIVRHGIRSVMCAPLICAGEVLGAIQLDTADPAKPFTKTELETLAAIAAQAALAVRQAHLVEARVEGQRLAAIGQTVAGLAHCVKNILNGMQGGSYILDRALAAGDSDRLNRGWDMVKRNAAFMSDLVMDMLSYARERQPVYEAVDPRKLLEGVRDLVNVRTGQHPVEVTVEVDPAVPSLRLDETAMKRCLLNLAVNAVDACEKDLGRVQLACAPGREKGTVRFTVADNGCGIAEKDMQRLFAVFFSTKGSKGTGLGLPVSKKVVEEHGGTIRVASTPGQGTTFTIDLPAVPPAGRETSSVGRLPPAPPLR